MKIFDTWHTFQIYSITQEGSPDRRTDRQTERRLLYLGRQTHTRQRQKERQTHYRSLAKLQVGLRKKEADIFFFSLMSMSGILGLCLHVVCCVSVCILKLQKYVIKCQGEANLPYLSSFSI